MNLRLVDAQWGSPSSLGRCQRNRQPNLPIFDTRILISLLDASGCYLSYQARTVSHYLSLRGILAQGIEGAA